MLHGFRISHLTAGCMATLITPPMSKRWLSSVDRAQREVLPLHLALYHAAREYPGGVKAVAAVYGLNPNTLQHKLNPAETRPRP